MRTKILVFLSLIPVGFSAILIAAHFLRGGHFLIVLLCLFFPAVLFFKSLWSVRVVQIILLLSSLEWIRSLIMLALKRLVEGEPWVRLAVILGSVAGLTACSSLVFYFPALKNIYFKKGTE